MINEGCFASERVATNNCFNVIRRRNNVFEDGIEMIAEFDGFSSFEDKVSFETGKLFVETKIDLFDGGR